eukprot:7775520-Pyramimonas_sp.AAC.1
MGPRAPGGAREATPQAYVLDGLERSLPLGALFGEALHQPARACCPRGGPPLRPDPDPDRPLQRLRAHPQLFRAEGHPELGQSAGPSGRACPRSRRGRQGPGGPAARARAAAPSERP